MTTKDQRTIAEARKELSAIGWTLSHTDGEFRVNGKGWPERSAYYTNDLEDAMATARTTAAMGAKPEPETMSDTARANARLALHAAGLDPDMTPKTSRTVNKALRILSISERLVRGAGYWYFIEGDASDWYSSSVPVYRITDMTLIRWVVEHYNLSHDGRNV